MGIQAFVHDRGLVTLPTVTRTPPSLTLHTARYDKTLDAYVDECLTSLPLAEEEHVAAVGNVGCRTTGLMCTFLVIATRERLTIGRLNESSYEVTGAVLGFGEEPCLECWLADGPTLVARYPSKLVVASELGHGCPKWKAHLLEGQFQRVFVAGNQVLCVASTGDDDSSSSEFVRSADLLKFSLNQAGPCALATVELPLELDPCLITCVSYVRSTTLGLSYKVVFGTSDGRLKCCCGKKVIMEVTLEESPLSVTIAESALGVPVLVVRLGGMDRKVVTFFAESLHQINSWTGIHQVVVDDLARVGHDQMLLITQPPTRLSEISFEHCLRISLLEPDPQNANEKHRSKILKSINEALEIRLQEGVKELQAAEQRRLDKMHMLTSACNLMQSIAIRDLDVPDDAVYMESLQLQDIYLGRCFLILHVHVNKNLQICRPTLFATSLHGSVKSMSTCLPSQGSNSQQFLFSFPLKECNIPLHLIFAAEVEGSKSRKIYTQWIHSIEDLPEPNPESGSLGNPTAVCEKWMSCMRGAVSQDHLMRAVVLQTNPGNYTWSTFKEGRRMEEHTKAPLTSMYVEDISLVSKSSGTSTNFLHTLSNLYGPRLVEMVIQFADVMLDEIQSCAKPGSEFSLTELQAATDRCFCHLLSSITYDSFGHFLEVTNS